MYYIVLSESLLVGFAYFSQPVTTCSNISITPSYTGQHLKPAVLADAINNGPKSLQFRQLIAWITNEIRVLGNMDEQVRHTEIYNFID